MNNADTLLQALDERLDSAVELTLYGRAALQLGFENPPEEYAISHDVDAVLWLGQAEELAASGNFWEAIEDLNKAYADQELYISHFFEEDQVVLLSDWKANRKRIEGPWKHLSLYRLGDEDLFLSKLMRNDPMDHSDAQFIVQRSGMTDERIRRAVENARVPKVPEICEQFAICAARFLE